MPRVAFIDSQVSTKRLYVAGGTAAFAVSALWLAFFASGCDRKGDERSEARTLMTSLNAVSDEGSLAKRSAALERLDRLPLRVESHVQTRNVCRTAHLALLEAEAAQAEARRALADGGTLDSSQSTLIAADIQRSTKALATAKQRFPECEQAMRKLLRSAH